MSFEELDTEVIGHISEVEPLAEFMRGKFGGDNQVGELAYRITLFLGKLWLAWLSAEGRQLSQLSAVALLVRNTINEAKEEVEQLG